MIAQNNSIGIEDALPTRRQNCAPAEANGTGGCTAESARALYAPIANSEDVEALSLFIRRCPDAPEADFARLRLQRLQSEAPAGNAPQPSAPAVFPTETDYRAAQTELKRLGLYASGIDGDWGPGSKRAMAAFQRAAGIKPADGGVSEQSLAALRRAPTPEAQPAVETFKECGACPEMAVIPGGSFLMGAPENEPGSFDFERPQHSVTVPGFALARTELTRGEWRRFVEATGHVSTGCMVFGDLTPNAGSSTISWSSPDIPQTDAHPVVCVSWADAQAYAAWLNLQVPGAPYRLPSEAEWEYAARAGTQTAFSWGADAADGCGFANGKDRSGAQVQPAASPALSCDDGYGYTAPVASYQANAFGLWDMTGNVNELVQDCGSADYAGAPTDGSARKSADGGPCIDVVSRGGSWASSPQNLRVANRGVAFPNAKGVVTGFRLARDAPR